MPLIFSVIMSAYNSEKWIGEAIDSIISQNIDFENNIEIIIVDDNSDDDTGLICKKYAEKYPNNIKHILNNKNKGPGFSRNVGLEYASGKYINFLDSDDRISKNTFKSVLNFFKQHPNVDLVSIPIFYFEDLNGPHYLNKKFEKTQEINLIDNPEFYQLSGPSSFIRKESIKDSRFPDIATSEDVVFINEILIKNPNIGLCSDCKYYYRKRSEKTSIIDNSKQLKGYYTPRVKNYFKHLIEKSLENYKSVPQFIQNIILYDLKWILTFDKITEILNKDEIKDLKLSIEDVLQYIGDETIYDYEYMSNYVKISTFLLKYGEITDEIFSHFNFNTITIDIYEIINNRLHILADYPLIKNAEVDVYVNSEKIEKNIIRFPQKDKFCLDTAYCRDYSFECYLDIKKDENYEIEFRINGKTAEIDFARPCNFSSVAGYAKTKDYLSILKGNKITIEHKTTFKWIKQEIKTLIKMARERKPGYKPGIPIRIAYMLGYPFFRNKRIWFFMDRPEISDDNGMHLFKYAVDKDKDIKKYFVINKDSPDFKEMEKIGPVLGYKSIKHRYLGLFVENIVSSHPDSQIIYPFWGGYPHFAGLLKSNNVFLQHGVILHDISSWLNKRDMNLSFFSTSSPYEYESILEYPYNYRKDTVKLLGLPRYDTLENEKTKKQILIMPTWRRDLEKKSKEYIIQTEYFKTFNSLINNKKLIEFAKENGYEIIFRPHPNVYRFIEEFDENDYVKIDYERVKYQTLFNQGSILITDYSSVAFDFAYLKKPLIYYHYGEDFHFSLDESYFDYETMGFGEICRSEDELVDLIIKNIKKNCKIDEKYEKRIDEFFAFTDKNNCKRVYDEIKKIPLKD